MSGSLGWLTAVLDVVLPASCAGCAAPGVALCATCRSALGGRGRHAMPQPAPDGLPPTFAAAAYDGPVRAVTVAHKERGRLALAHPLGAALAASVLAATATTASPAATVVLVPVPTSAAARRARGDDPTARIARRAAARLRVAGRPAVVLPALRHTRRVRDSVGLGAAARAANLAGAFGVPTALAPRVAGRKVVVVDDVVTTGATLAEAARALRLAGADVVAAATVAATVRQVPARRMGLHSERRRV